MSSLKAYVSSLDNETKCHGNHGQNNRFLILKSGCLSMIYENGNLRYISAGNREIIRMIYPSFRTKGWLTINPEISNEEIDTQSDSFRIRYISHYKSGEINFSARVAIEGSASNLLIFSMEGEAISSFEKNRIGFCVLHPIEENSGKNCIVEHSNGEKETAIFPNNISPHHPFTDIKSLKWEISGHTCTLVFSGDIFETEDQRNWTDASYKTYCTPLNLPFPVTLEKGDKISQTVELKIDGDFNKVKTDNGQLEVNVIQDCKTSFPMTGIGQSSRPEPLSDKEIQILKNLRFDHYRADLYMFSAGWRRRADLALLEAARLEYALELAVFFDDDFMNQLSGFINWITSVNHLIKTIIILHKSLASTPDSLLNNIGPLIRKALPGVKIATGTNANFRQLNKARPDYALADYISYSIQPQEHTGDNITLVENLQAQSYTVQTTNQFAKGKEIWVSPVNIQRRFNANIENYEQPFPGNTFLPQIDSRLMSLFGACWTTGSIKYLSEAGIKGVTFFETVGERGIFQGDQSSMWPEEFPSVRGMLFPVYFIFRYLLECKSYKVIKSNSSQPLKVISLVLSNGADSKMILVNFTSEHRKVIFRNNFEGSNLRFKQLNTDTFDDAVINADWLETAQITSIQANEELFLSPYSISFIDIEF